MNILGQWARLPHNVEETCLATSHKPEKYYHDVLCKLLNESGAVKETFTTTANGSAQRSGAIHILRDETIK